MQSAIAGLGRVASEEKRNPEHYRPTVYDWENKLAIVGYTGSPYPDTPWDIERGSPEARSGLFVLTEVSNLGIMASKVVKKKGGEEQFDLDNPIFIPWSSVHSIDLLKTSDESSDREE